MNTYTVLAKRWEKGWELHIDGVGITQSHTLSDAKSMASSYITMVTGSEPDEVVIVPRIDDELDEATRVARQAVRDAEDAQRKAAMKSRSVAQALRKTGLTGREVALVLGVSAQRVSQLLRSSGS